MIYVFEIRRSVLAISLVETLEYYYLTQHHKIKGATVNKTTYEVRNKTQRRQRQISMNQTSRTVTSEPPKKIGTRKEIQKNTTNLG